MATSVAAQAASAMNPRRRPRSSAMRDRMRPPPFPWWRSPPPAGDPRATADPTPRRRAPRSTARAPVHPSAPGATCARTTATARVQCRRTAPRSRSSPSRDREHCEQRRGQRAPTPVQNHRSTGSAMRRIDAGPKDESRYPEKERPAEQQSALAAVDGEQRVVAGIPVRDAMRADRWLTRRTPAATARRSRARRCRVAPCCRVGTPATGFTTSRRSRLRSISARTSQTGLSCFFAKSSSLIADVRRAALRGVAVRDERPRAHGLRRTRSSRRSCPRRPRASSRPCPR